MGSVDFFDAQRALEIEQTAVVSGMVDGNGDLRLYRRSGEVIEAGHVVGPAGELPSFVIPYKNAAALPATYQVGISIFATTSIDDWPTGLLSVVTTRIGTGRTVQVATLRTTAQSWTRVEDNVGGWGDWITYAGIATIAEALLGVNLVKAVTPGGLSSAISAALANIGLSNIPGTNLIGTGTGHAESYNPTLGTLAFSTCTTLQLDGVFETGYNYELDFLTLADGGLSHNTSFIFRSTVPTDVTASNYGRHVDEAGNLATADLAPNTGALWSINAATAPRQQTKLTLWDPRAAAIQVGNYIAYSDSNTTWATAGNVKNARANLRYGAATAMGGFKVTFSNPASGRILISKKRFA